MKSWEGFHALSSSTFWLRGEREGRDTEGVAQQPAVQDTHKFSILFIEKKKEENTGTSNARYPRLLFRPSLKKKKKNRLTLYLSVYQPHRPFKKNVVILLNRAPPQQFASIEKKKGGILTFSAVCIKEHVLGPIE